MDCAAWMARLADGRCGRLLHVSRTGTAAARRQARASARGMGRERLDWRAQATSRRERELARQVGPFPVYGPVVVAAGISSTGAGGAQDAPPKRRAGGGGISRAQTPS